MKYTYLKEKQIDENIYELLYMVHQRDDVAIRLMIHYFEEKIHILIRRFYTIHARSDHADYYQLAIWKLVQAVDTFREDRETSFSFYFEKILRHTFTDIQRRSKQSATYYIMDEQHLDLAIQDNTGYYQAKQGIDIHQVFLKKEEMKGVRKKLKPLEREILKLRLNGYSYQEIADSLHINKKKVDNTLYKVRYKKD